MSEFIQTTTKGAGFRWLNVVVTPMDHFVQRWCGKAGGSEELARA